MPDSGRSSTTAVGRELPLACGSDRVVSKYSVDAVGPMLKQNRMRHARLCG